MFMCIVTKRCTERKIERDRLPSGKETVCYATPQHGTEPYRKGRGYTHRSDRKTRPHFLSADLPEGCSPSSPVGPMERGSERRGRGRGREREREEKQAQRNVRDRLSKHSPLK